MQQVINELPPMVAAWVSGGSQQPADHLAGLLRTLRNAPAAGQSAVHESVQLGAAQCLYLTAQHLLSPAHHLAHTAAAHSDRQAAQATTTQPATANGDTQPQELSSTTPLAGSENSTILYPPPERPPEHTRLLTLLAQAAANLCAASGAEGAAQVWQGWFPGLLAQLLQHPASKVHDPTIMIIYQCCRTLQEAEQQLLGAASLPLWCLMLDRTCMPPVSAGGEDTTPHEDTDGGCSEWLSLLVGHLAFKRGQLQQLLDLLTCSMHDEGADAIEPVDTRPVTLLHILAHELASMQQLSLDSQQTGQGQAPWHSGLHALVRCLHQSSKQCGAVTPDSSNKFLKGNVWAQVLEAVMECLKSIAMRHDQLAPYLCREQQLVQQLLGLLASLQPIQNPRRAARLAAEQAAAVRPAPSSSNSTASLVDPSGSCNPSGGDCVDCDDEQVLGTNQGAGLTAGDARDLCQAGLPAQYHEGMPVQPPYLGYRGDLLAVLANAMFNQPQVAEQVAGLAGGVTLILSQCQLDDDSPLAKEWAMWAIRNLCAGSQNAIEQIAELQPVGAVQSPEMQQMGLSLRLNKATGKWEVKSDAKPPV